MMKQKRRRITLKTKITRLPNGHIARVDVIEHPGAALIVPFLSQNQVIFIRQFRPVIGCYLFELPAGTLDKNESAVACARREIIEETGFSAGRILRLGKIFPVPGYSTEIITIFKAERLIKKEMKTEPDEVITIRVFEKSTVQKFFRQGKIRDAKTICALAFCGWL